MLRNVYLEGELGTKFVKEFQVEASRPSEVFQCLDCNFPEFKQYMIGCADKDLGFTIEVGDSSIESEDELLLTLQDGDMVITPIPAGSKSGGAKILAAVFIVAAIIITGGYAAAAGMTWGQGIGSVLASIPGQLAAGLAINLALTGIQQLMAPDPSVDSDSDESYLFNGPQQNIVEGDPVPVLYGQLKVPGQPISFEILNRRFTDATDSWASTSDLTLLIGNSDKSETGHDVE